MMLEVFAMVLGGCMFTTFMNDAGSVCNGFGRLHVYNLHE